MSRICSQCKTKYNDDAVYCNLCDIDLDDTNSFLKIDVENINNTLTKARSTTKRIHYAIATLNIIAVLFLYGISIYNEHTLRDREWLILLAGTCIAAIHLLAAYGLSLKKQWGRFLSIFIGIYLLIGFPIGTILGFIIIKNMFRHEWKHDSLTIQ